MPVATLHGIRFYYEQAGTGPGLLFLNGTGGDLRHKPRLVDGPLAANLEILAHDQRGLGQSGKPDVVYTRDRLPDISAPTFLCGGRYDGIASPENMENLAQRIPNAELEFFEGGHGFLMEDRKAFARILDFLNRSS